LLLNDLRLSMVLQHDFVLIISEAFHNILLLTAFDLKWYVQIIILQILVIFNFNIKHWFLKRFYLGLALYLFQWLLFLQFLLIHFIDLLTKIKFGLRLTIL